MRSSAAYLHPTRSPRMIHVAAAAPPRPSRDVGVRTPERVRARRRGLALDDAVLHVVRLDKHAPRPQRGHERLVEPENPRVALEDLRVDVALREELFGVRAVKVGDADVRDPTLAVELLERLPRAEVRVVEGRRRPRLFVPFGQLIFFLVATHPRDIRTAARPVDQDRHVAAAALEFRERLVYRECRPLVAQMRVPAAKLVSAECPRRSRGVAATRLPRNIHVAAAPHFRDDVDALARARRRVADEVRVPRTHRGVYASHAVVPDGDVDGLGDAFVLHVADAEADERKSLAVVELDVEDGRRGCRVGDERRAQRAARHGLLCARACVVLLDDGCRADD